ncbi:MAG: hypothetical protein ACTSPG_02655 [Candidatus Hodarchaeales archaeon]
MGIKTGLEKKGEYFCYNILWFYLPIPDIVSNSNNSLQITETTNLCEYSKSIDFVKEKLNAGTKHNLKLSGFIRSVGPWRFNTQYLSFSSRQLYKVFNYSDQGLFPIPFPFYSVTQHNEFLNHLRNDLKLINPTLKIELYSHGFICIGLSYVTTNIPTGNLTRIIEQKTRKFIKRKKMSILNSIFSAEDIKEIFTQITPEEGFHLHITQSEKAINNTVKRISGIKLFINVNLGRFRVFQVDEQKFIILSWKMSRTLRENLIYPIKWVMAFFSTFNNISLKIIKELQNDEISQEKAQSLWILAIQGLNVNQHYPSYEGSSPLFPKDYQRKLFRKFSQYFQLDNKYKNFLKTLKHQAENFSIQAHYGLLALENEAKIDPRLKLQDSIKSNLRRVPILKTLSLSRMEQNVVDILVKKYIKDYENIRQGIGTTESMGCLVKLRLAEAIGWKGNKVYSDKKHDLQEIIFKLYQKGLIKTKHPTRRKDLYICLDLNSSIIRKLIARKLYK